MFVHFMPIIAYVCTALLPLGVIKDISNNLVTKICAYWHRVLNPVHK